MEHLLQYQIIHYYQHGFRQGYSVESQLITIAEYILAICNGSQATKRCYTFTLPKGI